MATEKKATEKKPNPAVKFFKEVKNELKKVAWPTWKQLRKNTIVVVVAILLVGAFISVLDLGFGLSMKYFTENRLGNGTQAPITEQAPVTEQAPETGEAPAAQGQTNGQ